MGMTPRRMRISVNEVTVTPPNVAADRPPQLTLVSRRPQYYVEGQSYLYSGAFRYPPCELGFETAFGFLNQHAIVKGLVG